MSDNKYSFYIEIVRVKNKRIQTQICWWLLFVWYYIAYFHHKKLDNASTSKMSKTTNTDLLHIISVLSSSLVHTYTRSQPKLKRTKLCVVVKHQTCGDPHHHMSIYRATMKCPLGRKERNLVSLKVLKWINMRQKRSFLIKIFWVCFRKDKCNFSLTTKN